MKKTFKGSCHCGAVRYEADIDLAEGTVRCNCSICRKGRNWLAGVKGDDFRLLAGAADLAEYRFGKKVIRHRFCRHCGLRPFSHKADDSFYAVNLATLDDASPEELVGAPVVYVDGLHDNLRAAPAETRHL